MKTAVKTKNSNVKVIIRATSEEMSKEAARIFADRIRKKPNIVLGLATGGTPVKMYKELIRMHKEEGLDFSKVITYNLDEYLGISSDHDQSYRYFMNDNLFNHINIKKENTHVLNGKAKDAAKECKAYEDAIKKAGGIDIQLLGIGGNGHIAFNEPGSPKASRTRVVDLTEKTIQDNARFFASASDVPRQALTTGNGTIMEAKEILLIADKASKADAIAKSLEGPITEKVPASLLREHKNVTFVIDKDAASNLKGDYSG
ncbi:MAG: glucosamine-6-phosphate deaminase [Candidatus Omnitrophica bacterium CG07_land_8_20_14_0_80_42_15]|uniref:Glucosamine-6-phosphate deaminase n=1 Tax=Candidatus Aquitaenariimonas noxiae TaxID=1974741 RepID=A0A2J0L6L5_9BACT|nr:MAG: glucosamine-6-phosphate deaminase [Candidatus Omnitrophica bacterium CG07_land_8_20_14_0_80_42_15]